MRPVSKGSLPYRYTNGSPYGKAASGLAARIGRYCSYCERVLDHGMEVEHIQPKSLHPLLETQWSNFLLSCKNCNATKSKHDPALSDWLIPDRDNTAAAFVYQKDGVIEVEPSLLPPQSNLADQTLRLMKLNRKVRRVVDEKGTLIALDRRSQRLEAWLLADRWAIKFANNPSPDVEDAIIDLAKTSGFFSIWMAAFETVPAIRNRLINGFSGTEHACFDPHTTLAILPHPNTDAWLDGGKL
ncbi:retron system putative HNH endonuclease [Burkholderia gladioli]|uniref:retron system putative HNH endonuclease n=1 Tax=Burkholderia gladioli TaxID=28095 RepID=UPI00163F3970|nr:retron system putative HNH endonuclease [Burkholderia gladioli]